MGVSHRLLLMLGSAIAFALAAPLAVTAAEGSPAYVVVEINVTDQEGFQEYAEKATETVFQNGGSFLTFGEHIETIEGPPPNGSFVIIKFDSMEEARNWLSSPEYSDVKGIRHRTAEARQYLVEGLAAD